MLSRLGIVSSLGSLAARLLRLWVVPPRGCFVSGLYRLGVVSAMGCLEIVSSPGVIAAPLLRQGQRSNARCLLGPTTWMRAILQVCICAPLQRHRCQTARSVDNIRCQVCHRPPSKIQAPRAALRFSRGATNLHWGRQPVMLQAVPSHCPPTTSTS